MYAVSFFKRDQIAFIFVVTKILGESVCNSDLAFFC